LFSAAEIRKSLLTLEKLEEEKQENHFCSDEGSL